jgi:putative transposase
MPRQARLDAPGTLHHVMIRGIEGRDIFTDDGDRAAFVSRLGKIVQEGGTKVVAWALMSNHVHLLLFSGAEGLSKLMRRLLTGYAIVYNLKHKRSGHLFQNRYKSIVCDENAYLLELVRYIHLNPVRAGLVGSIEGLGLYPWTGHRVLIGKAGNGWQERGMVLGQLGSQESEAIERYKAYMEEGKGQGRRPELVGGGLIRSMGGWSQVLSSMGKRDKAIEYDDRILGGGEFVSQIISEAEKKIRKQVRSGEKKYRVGRVIEKACKKAGIKEQELRHGGRRWEVSRLRAKVARQLSRELGVSFAEIARNLGVGTSAIAKAMRDA